MNSMKFQNVKSWLASKHIKVIDSWLTDCIDYFLTENANIPLQTLQNKVYEQWKLADLCDIGIPCFPQISISTDMLSKREPLKGCYALQIQSVLDISVPAYNQLEQIYKITRHKLEDEKQEKSSRMLKLILTDGAVKIEASELQPISCLKSTLKPGTKVILKGPIKMSYNGVLLLKEGNISVLGGEVDCLLDCNSLVNTLLKSIGLSKDDNPYKNIISTINFQTQISNTMNSSIIMGSSVISETPLQMDELITQELNDLDEIFFEEDCFETMHINETAAVDHENAAEKNILNPNYAIKHNNISLIYVKQLNEIQNELASEMKFVIIIQINEFIEPLRIRNGEWQNLVCVTDFLVQNNESPQHSVKVKLHSDVINHFTGYSRTDMLNLRHQIGHDQKIRENIINHLAIIKECFENCIYIAHIIVPPSVLNEIPVITILEELKNEHSHLVNSKQNFD